MKSKVINLVTIAGLVGNAGYHHQEFINIKLGKKQMPELQPTIQPIDYPTEEVSEIEKKSWDIRSKYSETKPTRIEKAAATFYGKTTKVKGEVVPNGEGLLYYDDQRTQIGQFKNGALTGKGMQYDPQQGTIIGNFSNGELNGVGHLKTNLGNQYDGEFQGSKPFGKGLLRFANGNYCYTSKNDEKYFASCYTRQKKLFYDGEFNGQEAHGKGKMLLNDKGYTYEGDFVDGKRIGHGVEKDSYGDIVYQGEYVDNMPSQKLVLYQETLGYFAVGTLNILLSIIL